MYLCVRGIFTKTGKDMSCICVLGVSLPRQEKMSCICVFGVPIWPLSIIYLLDFGPVPTVWYFILFFIFILLLLFLLLSFLIFVCNRENKVYNLSLIQLKHLGSVMARIVCSRTGWVKLKTIRLVFAHFPQRMQH